MSVLPTKAVASMGMQRLLQGSYLILAWSVPTSLFGMQAATILGLVAFVAWWALDHKRRLHQTPLNGPMLALLGAVGLSLLLAPNGVTSFQSATSFWVWGAFLVAYAGFSIQPNLRLVLVGLLLLSALVAVLGLIQSYTGWFPIGSTLHPQVTPLLKPAFGAPDRFCAVGLFYSRVTLAHILLFSFCWMLALLLEPISLRIRLLLAAGIALTWMGMTCTWVRSVPPVAGLAALVLIGIKIKGPLLRGRRGLLRLGVVGVLVSGVVLGGIWLAPGLLQRSKASFQEGRDWGRLTIWQSAMDLASAQPFSGVGFGNFRRDVLPLIDERVQAIGETRFAGVLAWAHNDLLTWWSECGVIGAFAFCWLFVAYFRRARQGLKLLPADDFLRRGFVQGSMVAVGAFLVSCFFHDNFFHGEISFALWFTLGASLAAVRKAEES